MQADKAYTFTLLDVDYDLLSYVGHEVDLWVNDDDEVVSSLTMTLMMLSKPLAMLR